MGAERFTAPVVMFNLSLIGVESDGVHQLLYVAIRESNETYYHMANNIIVIGYNVCFHGF